MVIPDVQHKPGCSTDHLRWAGLHAVDQLPDTIIVIGDWWDMESLSSYDKGQKSFEGRRYWKDIESGNEAMDVFMAPIVKEVARRKRNKKKGWEPRLIFTTGNHEYRIDRAVEKQAELETMLSRDHFNLEKYGYEVYDYLEPVVVDGVAYSHFFTSGVLGRPVSSARAMLTKKFMSCCMGHVQQRDIAFGTRADGKRITGIFCGIYYQHDEGYLTPQTNTEQTWSGIWIFNEVKDGSFDELPVSMNYLRGKYS
jgi:hypothetical protein